MFGLDLEEEMRDLKWEADVQHNELSSGLCADQVAGMGVGWEGGDMCTLRADSRCCVTLYPNHQ